MGQRFYSSRLTSGNRIFRSAIGVEEDGVHFEKRRLFGGSEEVVHYRQIASVKINRGLFFATLEVETAGGSQPITISGLGKHDAKTVVELIQRMQARA